jgi:hypothetical protein
LDGDKNKCNLFFDFLRWCETGGGIKLRQYQQAAARAILQSVFLRQGLSLVVQFPRQSGKNELQAQIECFLLASFAHIGAEIVKISPTWRPQALNAMGRLEHVLQRNLHTRDHWEKVQGSIYRMGKARIIFLSGAPTSSIVGATASLLLECDEAQDIELEKWDKEILPMAAATNATRVLWGTAWSAQTLLGRELRLARSAEMADGQRRVFVADADQVALEVPEYGAFVAEQVRRLGRSHPMIRTQFFNEELDGESALFNPSRLALMQGDHPARSEPEAGQTYALLIDVGGEEAYSALEPAGAGVEPNPSDHTQPDDRRDSTALTVVEVDLSQRTLELEAPTYRAVNRQVWNGEPHNLLYERIKALAGHWRARYTVIDATGVGAGLASFLERALGRERLIPFLFNAASKSELGWRFLSIVETRRYREFQPGLAALPDQDRYQCLFLAQARACQSQIVPGPGRILRWGVPESARSAEDNSRIHDDLLVSAALCAVLDRQDWGMGRSLVIPGRDILGDLRPAY